jgi:predicted dehydrogenase
MDKKIKVGVIGCGNISSIYLEQMKTFDILEVVACADLIMDRARDRAAKYGIPRACTDEELWADPEIQIVLNITNPLAHAEVALGSLQAGKSVYDEKPLTTNREDAQQILKLAEEKGLRVGGAPDTFLGAGLQTCRKLIDEGAIGEPIAATAFMTCHGHESWHPDPEFYYQVGGGPMFDMGPYYLTALVSLLGPVKSVAGMTRITFPERTITSKAKYGKKIQVEVPTHVAGLMNFANGAVGTIITSFDVWGATLPWLEIYGTEGSLHLPDPNGFGGEVKLWRPAVKEWENIPLIPWRSQNSRSLGLADMAHAIRSGRPHRANGKMGYHVLDIMHAFHDASRLGKEVELESTCERPAPIPLNQPHNLLED